MGITKLAELIRNDAKGSISYKEIGDYTGKVIAFDTSIVVNQFRSAVPNQTLSLQGLFYRTLTFLEHDIKPLFVFDGKPPEQKKALLEKRAQNAGWKSSDRSNTVSPQTQDTLCLLQHLGVPCVTAPGDAEAFCAHLVKSGLADAVASEDMDTLAFGGTVLLRQLNASKASEVIEYSLPKLLDSLQLTQEQFVDVCILLGCDYCEKIGGLGPTRALKLIREHKTIENVLLIINRETHPVPERWQYQAARRIFLEVPQSEPPTLQWKEPDEEKLVKFLCTEKRLRVKNVQKRMEKFRQNLARRRKVREEERAEPRQTGIEEFFRVTRKRQFADADPGSSKRKHPKSK